MTEQERIEHLKATPPKVKLTRGQLVAEIVGWVCSVIAIVALSISVFATQQAWDVARCVNTVLGLRTAPSTRDNQAHIAFARAVTDLFTPATTPAQREQVTQRFEDAANAYVSTLVADQANRDAHPLGKC